MDAVRLCIVGFGGMGQGMIRRAQHVAGVAVVAAVEVSPDGRKRAAAEFKLKTYETVEQMLDAGATDAVYIATPNKFHAEQAIQCLKAGVHVFCEKPMAMNAAEGERMVASARKARRKLTFNLSYRATGPARALKNAVDEGLLGDVYFARTGWLRNRGIPWKGWFNDKTLSGGGPLIDLGVHRIDLALWLMGYPRPVSVTGVTYDMLGKAIARKAGRPYTVEDLAAGFVRFENGAALSLETSWATNSELGEDMYTYVYGTKAGATHRSIGARYDFECRIWGETAGTFSETILQPAPAPDHLEGFVRAIREDGPVPVEPEDILKVQRIIDALYRSAETGAEVRLQSGRAARKRSR
jgi:predicted dehydrogenase